MCLDCSLQSAWSKLGYCASKLGQLVSAAFWSLTCDKIALQSSTCLFCKGEPSCWDLSVNEISARLSFVIFQALSIMLSTFTNCRQPHNSSMPSRERRTMAGSFTKILDCRKEVRDYRLVPNPSRWKQKGERVMIQSPMLEILESTSHVPAKRYSYGQAQNYACFLLRDDIDYHYTGTRGWIDAHGVALFNSSSTDQLHFERGQRFWLNIKPETNASETTVPVINLDTFDEGTINIDKVCWYPKVQGPNHELWTLGGDIRKQKLVGSRKFIYWSWVICQRLDGSTPTTKMAEIPTREVECQGKRLLSSSEAKSLFEQRYRNMEKPTAPADVLSPPLTPLQCSECIQKRSRAPDEDQQTPTRYKESRDLWRRIFSMAKKNGGSYKCLQRSNIHPQKLTPPPLPLPPRNNNGQVAMVESSTIDEDDSNPAPLPIENSPSTTPQPPSSEHKIPEPEDDSANRAAQHLVQMSHSQVPSSLEILEISDDLCDLYGLKCKYTPIST